jgi:diadenosine tetraphosphate (Ap4A) HIT family hydrolase
MTQTPKQWYDRVHAVIGDSGYREPDFSSWMSWPWVGDLTTKPLDPPVAAEPARAGGGGAGDCQICTWSQDPDIDYLIWRDETWMIGLPFEPSSLPFAAFLMPRRHADLQDLTPAESARQGELLTGIERAACAVLAVPRIQVARWGDGSEHLHWWMFARPTGQLQLRGTFLALWDDLLPGADSAATRSNGELLAAKLVELAGGEVVVRRTGSAAAEGQRMA